MPRYAHGFKGWHFSNEKDKLRPFHAPYDPKKSALSPKTHFNILLYFLIAFL